MDTATIKPSNQHNNWPQPGRATHLQPGDTLQDRYRIMGVLGRGGFSAVYQARDLRFPDVTRLCAVKEMINVADDPTTQAVTTASFHREANILATLDHPAIPEVYDAFTIGDRSYLVLEFIRGHNLETLLAQKPAPISQEQALDWALQLCDVLATLHRHQPQPLVFRDLKPSNVMLDQHGRLRLIDFGIARNFQSGVKGTMIGTEGYSPPEQYRGEATPAGDVYALGAMLHCMLTQQDPRLETPFTFAERPIRSINPAVSPEFEAIIMRCLAYEAGDRYPNATALRAAVQPLVGQKAPSAQPSSRLGAVPANTTRHQVAPVARRPGGVSPIWTFRCQDEIRAAPVVAGGAIYFGAYDNNLYALDAASGNFLWSFATSAGISGSPALSGEAIYVGSADRHLYSLRLHSGRLNWRFAAEGPIYSSPRAHFDHIFFGADDGFLYVVNSAGRLIWRATAHSAVRSSPSFSNDRVIFGTEGGYVFALDLNGGVAWQFQARRGVTSTPAIADDTVFVGSLDGGIYALDANSGWAVWQHRTRRPIISSPAVDDDTVYIGSSDGQLYAINRHTGQKSWSFETGGQISSSPAIWGNALYFGCTDGSVYSITRERGQLRWRFETDGMVISSPAIANDVVYIGSADHNLYALPA